MRLLPLVLLAFFALTGPAAAVDFQGPLAQWMTWEQAISKMPGPVGPTITISTNHCPGTDAWGCADLDDGVLYIAARDRFMAYHELGHFYDARNLNDQNRADIMGIMGIGTRTQWQKKRNNHDTCGHKDCPSEMFADAYANCALGASPAGHRAHGGRVVGGWESPYGYAPTVMEQRAICSVIRAAAAGSANNG